MPCNSVVSLLFPQTCQVIDEIIGKGMELVAPHSIILRGASKSTSQRVEALGVQQLQAV